MKNWLPIVSIAFLLAGVSDLHADAPCTVENPISAAGINSIPPAPEAAGQSFIACRTGDLVSLSVYVRALMPGEAILKLHHGTDLLNAAWSETVSVADSLNTYILGAPFPVVDGQEYSWSMTRVGNSSLFLRQTSQNRFPGGMVLRLSTSGALLVAPDSDQIFTALIADSGVPSRRVTWGAIKARGSERPRTTPRR